MRKKGFVLIGCLSILLILCGCKTTEQGYDIRGTWSIAIQLYGSSITNTWTITFTGSETSGTAADNSFGTTGTGTYTVNSDQVTFVMNYVSDINFTANYTGTITNDNSMNGDLALSGSSTGIWTATR
jgi:hypothetical protein